MQDGNGCIITLNRKGSVITAVNFLVTPGGIINIADNDTMFKDIFASFNISVSHPSIYSEFSSLFGVVVQ